MDPSEGGRSGEAAENPIPPREAEEAVVHLARLCGRGPGDDADADAPPRPGDLPRLGGSGDALRASLLLSWSHPELSTPSGRPTPLSSQL